MKLHQTQCQRFQAEKKLVISALWFTEARQIKGSEENIEDMEDTRSKVCTMFYNTDYFSVHHLCFSSSPYHSSPLLLMLILLLCD